MPFVLWQLYFPKVFKENGGFDIVIGNPPYVQLQVMHEEADKLQHIGFKTYERTGDIYCLFYEQGYNLLSKNGFLCFITSNKWMRANYGKSLRDFFVKNTNPVQLLDFAGNKIFENATVDVNILLFGKSENKRKTKACIADSNCRKNISDFFQQNKSEMDFKVGDSWVVLSPIEQSIKRKIEAVGTPLKNWDIQINYGIKTGYNDAFIISGEKKDELIKEDPKSAEIIRPILRGRDIKRYGYDFADLWLIATFPSRKYDIENYPAVKKHLLSFGIERLEQTGKTHIINGEKIKARKKTNNKWFETQDSIAYWGDFSKQKIITKGVGSKLRFGYDDNNSFCTAPACFITGKHIQYLTTILNSKMGNYLFRNSQKTGTGDLMICVQAIEPVQIPILTNREEYPYNELLSKILDCINNNKDFSKYEEELDDLVFDLYKLNKEERQFVSDYVIKLFR